jgi:hypothetical protein
LFRAEIHISGNTPREQRLAIAADLKRMAEKVILDNAPLSGAARVTISNGDKLAGEGWFEAGLLGRVVA